MTDERDSRLRAELATALAELEPLVAVSQATQEEVLAFRERYDRTRRDAPLAPGLLRDLHEGRRRYLNLQDRLAALAGRYAPLADPSVTADVDPLLRFHGLSISLLASLTLYDNYLSLLTILEDDRLRRLAYDREFGYGIEEGAFRKIMDGLNSPRARRTLHELAEAWAEADETLRPTDETSVRLRKAVESSVSYRHAHDASGGGRLPSAWRVRRTRFLDALSGLGESALGTLSKVFGNGIGLVEVRKGKLWQDELVLRHLLGVLKPLDLLLEKTPFRLTDVFIPGHFGHVAIWMGTDAELDTLGLWGRPEMQSKPLRDYREKIRTGRSVLEALRTGVELNTLEHFLNVDDVAILRPTRLQGEDVAESLVRGFQQVGKEYDFNFDVETTGTIVCSELPYHVYPGVDWQTDTQLGRYTISPDHVAAQALMEHGAFELIVLYHDGRLIESEAARSRMDALMRDG